MSKKTKEEKKDPVKGTKKDFVVFRSEILRIQDGKHDFFTDYIEDKSAGPKGLHWMTPLPYDSYGGTPYYWDEFLNKILPDPEDQKILYEFIYSCLIIHQRAPLQHLIKGLIIKGPSPSGKSILGAVIRELLGHQNCCSFSINQLINNDNSSFFNRAHLTRQLLNISDEFEYEGLDSCPTFRTLIQGDMISYRFPYDSVKKTNQYARQLFIVQDGGLFHGMDESIQTSYFNVLVCHQNEDIKYNKRGIIIRNIINQNELGAIMGRVLTAGLALWEEVKKATPAIKPISQVHGDGDGDRRLALVESKLNELIQRFNDSRP